MTIKMVGRPSPLACQSMGVYRHSYYAVRLDQRGSNSTHISSRRGVSYDIGAFVAAGFLSGCNPYKILVERGQLSKCL